MKKVTLSLLLALALFLLANTVFAVVLEVEVVDSVTENPIAGATVKCTPTLTNIPIYRTTNSNGIALFNVPTGSYDIWVSKTDYITKYTMTTVSMAPRQYERIELEEEDPGIGGK